MQAKKMWIAEHPEHPHEYEVTLEEPDNDYTWVYPSSGEAVMVEYKEYVCIPVEY